MNIQCGNCLELIKNIPDNSVDCIVTDPPYRTTPKGCAGTSGGMMRTDLTNQGKVFEHNDTPITEYAADLFRVLKDGGHCYVMTNHINLTEMLNTLQGVGFHFTKCLIWDKSNKIMGRFYMSQYEYIIFLHKGDGVAINNCGTSDILSVPNRKSKQYNSNIHDTEKPVNLMRILIENSTQEGQIVLDPFMGSGSTGVACKLCNRHFIGYEIDPKYYAICESRIKSTSPQITRNKSLF